MPLNVNDLTEELGPTRRARVEERAAELIAEEMTLRKTVETMEGSTRPCRRGRGAARRRS